MEVKKATRLTRKPSKKVPVIKQTKGSLLRMIKSNPLIAVDENVKKELGITDAELKRLGHIPMVKNTMSLSIYKKNCGEDKLKSNHFVRRSFSAENFNEKKRLSSIRKERELNRTYSEEDVSVTQPESGFYNFKTPQNRRSSFTTSTVKTIPKNHLNSPSSTPGDIKMKLNKWLHKRGKSSGAYHHLKCFGIPLEEIEEDKENIEQKPPRSESYEALGIKPKETENNIETNFQNPFIDYEFIAKDALNDLYKLIQDSYSSEQCSQWLTMIRDKCKNIEEEPTYWECRAALEERNENLPNAILCYRTAIIKGAKIETVNSSLDLLLEKFSLLNIDSSKNEKEDKTKRRVIIDARNVFKSTIIQFAVQERDNKKKELANKLVTPVRRSARLSCYSNSRRVTLCSSFKDIEDNENVDFKNNKFLSVRYN